MPYYRFVVRDGDSRAEELGVMDLRDDGDARSFAGGVIRDLKDGHPALYLSWTLDITEDERTVASIAFNGSAEE